MLFRFENTFPRSDGRPGLNSRFGFFRSFPDQFDQAVNRISTVLFLRSELFCLYDQNAFFRDSSAGKPDQSGTDIIGKSGGVFYIKTELDGGGHLVDILTSGPGCPYEMKFDFLLFY